MRNGTMTYRNTGRFAPLLLDYLDGDPFFAPLIAHPFSRDGLGQAAAKRTFDPRARATLCGALDRQYAGVDLPAEVRRNLDLLKKEGTLTITTGHQLCLFTGPLYSIFKVLNAIRLARDLSTAERPIVPVFWMASEDHDRAEIDHAWIFGRKVHWPGEAGGPAGRMRLDGIEAVLKEVDGILGEGANADALRSILHGSYRPGLTLAQATRRLLTALFGRFGLVVIDGDDHDLKKMFAPVMKEEALHQVVKTESAKADAILRQRYEPQAHAREINLFHLSDLLRARIEKDGARFKVLDGGTEYSTEELLDALDDRPQVFSPNVLLRPLYQETVLPDIAYVGGPAEVAYWLQLKPVFDRLRVPMPVVVPRTSALLLDGRERERLNELELSIPDLFRPIEEMKARIARSATMIDTDLSTEKQDLIRVHEALAARARAVDPSLEAAVKADAQRALKALEHLEQKLLRAAKRAQELPIQRFEKLHAQIFPEGALQERRENFIPWHLRHGPAFFDRLLGALDPIAKDFTVIELDQ